MDDYSLRENGNIPSLGFTCIFTGFIDIFVASKVYGLSVRLKNLAERLPIESVEAPPLGIY